MNKYNFQVDDHCLYDGNITCVTAIASKAMWVKNGRSESIILADSKVKAEPIPITDEWLDLNFERYYPLGDDYTYWRSEDHRLTISTLSNMVGRDYDAECLRKIHLDNEYFETIGGCASCYVHHVQHLCRDCEYEFEPKFK